jgi:hypothetical protein
MFGQSALGDDRAFVYLSCIDAMPRRVADLAIAAAVIGRT